MHTKGISLSIALPALALVAGCSIMFDPEVEQCERDTDCTSRPGTAFATAVCQEGYCVTPGCRRDSDCAVGQSCDNETRECAGEALPGWECLHELEKEANALPMTRVLTMDLTIQMIGGAPVAGTEVRVCETRELDCEEATYTLTTDIAGHVQFDVPATYSGYVELAASEEHYAEVYFLTDPLPRDGQLPTMEVISPTAMEDQIAAGLGDLFNPEERGFLVVTTSDCTGEGAGGLILRASNVDPEVDLDMPILYHRVNPVPGLENTLEGFGVGSFNNMRRGNTVVEVIDKETGTVVKTLSPFVRPNTLTATFIQPRSDAVIAQEMQE